MKAIPFKSSHVAEGRNNNLVGKAKWGRLGGRSGLFYSLFLMKKRTDKNYHKPKAQSISFLNFFSKDI